MSSSARGKPSAETLARYFPGVVTGDKIASPTPKTPSPTPSMPESASGSGIGHNRGPALQPEDAVPEAAKRWSLEKRYALELVAPYALYIAAADGPVSITLYHPDGSVKKRFGHNRGCWAVKIGSTGSHRDTITPLIDKVPWVPIKVRRRVWMPTASEVASTVLKVTDLLAANAEQAGFDKLLHGYVDGGPDFNEAEFERHILLLARRLRVVAWTEEGLSEFLDKVLRVAKAKTESIEIIDVRGRRIVHPDVQRAFQRLADRLIEQVAERQFPGRG